MTTGMMTKTIAGLFPYKHNGGCEDRGQVTVPQVTVPQEYSKI